MYICMAGLLELVPTSPPPPRAAARATVRARVIGLGTTYVVLCQLARKK